MVRGKMVFFIAGPGGGGIASHGYSGAFGPYNSTLGKTYEITDGTGDALISGVPKSVVEAVGEELEPMITSFMHHVEDDSDAHKTASTFGTAMSWILTHFVGGHLTDGGMHAGEYAENHHASWVRRLCDPRRCERA